MKKKILTVTFLGSLAVFTFEFYSEIVGWPIAFVKGASAAVIITLFVWFIIFIYKLRRNKRH